jgi:hypothetical protein
MSGLLKKEYVPDRLEDYPQTLRQARELVDSIYRAEGNEWGEIEQRHYCEMLGIPYAPVYQLPLDSLRIILADLEKFSMVRFKQSEHC